MRQGETITAIHEDLTKSKLITIKYVMFCRYVDRFAKDIEYGKSGLMHHKNDASSEENGKKKEVQGKHPIKPRLGSSRGFTHRSKANIDDLAGSSESSES